MVAIKNGLMKQIREEEAEKKAQEELRIKHHIDDEKVLIVEKNNVFKFTVKTVAAMIRVAASVIVLILAIIGLLSLLYPSTRAELITVFLQIKEQILSYF